MVTIRRTSDAPYTYATGYEDIAEIANMTRHVPDHFIDKRGNRVTDACVAYLLPLICGERYPAYENGLPKQYVID